MEKFTDTEKLRYTLIALNAMSNDMGFKYPIGNKELTLKCRELESDGIISFNPLTGLWSRLDSI